MNKQSLLSIIAEYPQLEVVSIEPMIHARWDVKFKGVTFSYEFSKHNTEQQTRSTLDRLVTCL